jgi:hypothetical protein
MKIKLVPEQIFEFRAEDKNKKFNSGETYYEFRKRCLIDNLQILENSRVEDFDVIITAPKNLKQ